MHHKEPSIWFNAIGWSALFVSLLTIVPFLWRLKSNEAARYSSEVAKFAPAPENMVRGTIRAFPTAIVTWWFFGATFLVNIGFRELGRTPPDGWFLIRRICACIFVVGNGLAVSIWLFNWPKSLVAPGFRGEDGALARVLKAMRLGRGRE